MKFPKIFHYEDEQGNKVEKPKKEKQETEQEAYDRYERKRRGSGISIYHILTAMVLCMIVVMGFAITTLKYPTPAPPMTIKGTVVQVLDVQQTSELVGKITETKNSTWLVVSYPWAYNNHNVTLVEPSGELKVDPGSSPIDHLAAGSSVDLILSYTGSMSTIDGVAPE